MGLSDQASIETSVVVVSHNEGENLLRTVQSFLEALPAASEIIVVDDVSSDGSIEELPADRVQIVRPETRLGISAARNLGASRAHGDVLIFSDAHVDVTPGFLQPLRDALKLPGVGAVGPVVSTRGFETSKGFGFRWRDPALNVEWLNGHGRGPAPYPVPMLVGCFMVVRRNLFDQVGGFDDGMIVYGHEDAELSMRLWVLGHRCLLVPEVDITHLFRETHPYAVDWTATLHNLLRVAVVHFSTERFRRVVACLKGQDALPSALAMLLEGDAYERRRAIRDQRTRDEEWYFREFHMHW
jgi:GT2 family glycosyltransferase